METGWYPNKDSSNLWNAECKVDQTNIFGSCKPRISLSSTFWIFLGFRENKLYCLFFSKYSTETSTQDKQLRSKHQEYILLEQEYEKEKRLKEAALIENK